MLGNGSGKHRADREGNARPPPHMAFCSSSPQAKLALPTRSRKMGAGAERPRVNRCGSIDLLADAGAGLGIFEELHEFPTAEKFARHLREAADRSYGTAIRAFLAKISCDMEAVCAAIKKQIQHFVRVHVPEGADGQVYRVAQRFGLIAAAGEMAVAAGRYLDVGAG